MSFLFRSNPTSGIIFKQDDENGEPFIVLKATSIGGNQYELNDFYGVVSSGINPAKAAAQAAYNETCGLAMVNGDQLAMAGTDQTPIITEAKTKVDGIVKPCKFTYKLMLKAGGNESVYLLNDDTDPENNLYVLGNYNYEKIKDETSLPIIGSFNSSKLAFVSYDHFQQAMAAEMTGKSSAGFEGNIVYTAIDGPNSRQPIGGRCIFSDRLHHIMKKLGMASQQ